MGEGLQSKHALITTIMIRQGSEGSNYLPEEPTFDTSKIAEGLSLPLIYSYVDPDGGHLVVGLDETTKDDAATHEQILGVLLGDTPITIEYGSIRMDAAPAKNQDARPLWGGVQMQAAGSAGTLTLVVSKGNTNHTILSSHVVGSGTGQVVGQLYTVSGKYGVVKENPPYISGRASDSALASIDQLTISGQVDKIWSAPNTAYKVVGKTNSGSIPTNIDVYLQGAFTQNISKGKVFKKGVTFKGELGTLLNQVLASYDSQEGDSGGPVMYFAPSSTTDVYFIGIHVGRMNSDGSNYAVFSPWEGIKSDLKL